jgi:hypothetical protein
LPRRRPQRPVHPKTGRPPPYIRAALRRTPVTGRVLLRFQLPDPFDPPRRRTLPGHPR